MKVTFCDVCGDPTPAPTTLRLEKAPSITEGDYEICVPCKLGLLAFLRTRRTRAEEDQENQRSVQVKLDLKVITDGR